MDEIWIKVADIFFDDQLKNVERASDTITSAHVPYGVKNKRN